MPCSARRRSRSKGRSCIRIIPYNNLLFYLQRKEEGEVYTELVASADSLVDRTRVKFAVGPAPTPCPRPPASERCVRGARRLSQSLPRMPGPPEQRALAGF